MTIGSIVVDLLAKTGSFETDLNRSARLAAKRAKEIDASFQRARENISNSFAGLGIAAAAGLGAAFLAFDKLTKAAGDYQDMAEKTGDSAEAFASMALSAGTAGVGMDVVAAASVRLTAALSKTDDEGKGVGKALGAIGLELEAFKALKPADQMEAVAKALDGFEDGAGKTAVAVALWGKNGAELLPFLKELAAEGGRSVILSQEQITLADQYADRQARLRTEIGLHAQAVATQMLPAWNSLAGAALGVIKDIGGIEDGTRGLSNSTAIQEFAYNAVKALGSLVDWLDDTVRLLRMLAVGLTGVVQAGALAGSGNFREMAASTRETADALGRIANAKYFSSRIQAPKFADPRLLGDPGSIAQQTAKTLNFDGSGPAKAARAKAEKAERDWMEKRLKWLDEYDTWELKEQDETLKEKRKLFTDHFDLTFGAELEAADKQRKALEEQGKKMDDYAERGAKRVQGFLGDGLYDLLSGDFDSIGDKFADLMKRMAAEAVAAQLARAMFGNLVEGGTGTGALGSVAQWFGGFFADGGSPPVGKISMVGENGPELFVPRTAGTIVPNHAMGGGGGGGPTIIINNTIGNVASQSDVVHGMQVVRQQILGQLSRSARMGGSFA